MDKNNKQLYYMFLVFTQKQYGIEILPNLHVTKPLMTSVNNLHYSIGFTKFF